MGVLEVVPVRWMARLQPVFADRDVLGSRLVSLQVIRRGSCSSMHEQTRCELVLFSQECYLTFVRHSLLSRYVLFAPYQEFTLIPSRFIGSRE